MKEAAGEANMTVITIVLIGIVLLIGGVIVTSVMNGSKGSACCTSAGGTWKNGDCTNGGQAFTDCMKDDGDNTNDNSGEG